MTRGPLLLGALLALSSVAQAQSEVRVERVIGASGDAWDAARVGDAVVVATSAGAARCARGACVPLACEGLAGARLRSVSVTSDGDVWLGGIDGLARVRLEGSRCVVVHTLALRRTTRVTDSDGVVYVGTASDGLFALRGDAAPVAVRLGASPARARITDVVVHRGVLTVATLGAGVFELDAALRVTSRTTTERGLPDDAVWDLEPSGQALYAATLRGVARLERGGHAAPVDWDDALRVHDVRRLVGTDHGWLVATWGAGAARISEDGSLALLGGVVDARAAAELGSGVLVAHAGGVDFVGGAQPVAWLTPALPSADITALARAFGRLWVGTYGAGLCSLDGAGAITNVDGARWGLDARINDLAFAAGRLWIATDRGLFVHDGQSFSPVDGDGTPGRAHVTALHVADDGALWVASSRLLARFDAGRWRAYSGNTSLPIAQLHAVTTDARGRIWVGSLHGLLELDPATGTFTRRGVAHGALPVDWVTSVARWDRGIVAGTYHGGLSFGDGDAFRIVREGRGGVPSGWVNPHAMEVLGGALWFGTLDRGLVIGRPGSWRTLGLAEGLPSADVTDVLADGDRAAWVATRGGLARVTWTDP